MTRGARRIGFLVSAIVHVAGAALLVRPGTAPVESAAPRAVPIDLEMFVPVFRAVRERRDAAAAAAQAVPPQPVRRAPRRLAPEAVAGSAVDPPRPVATASPRPRPAAAATPVTAPPPVVPPTPRRPVEPAPPTEHAVERSLPAAPPIDRVAHEPAPRQRPRVATATTVARPPPRPLPRAVERATRSPGDAAPPLPHDIGQAAAPPPAPAAAEVGPPRPVSPAAATRSPQPAAAGEIDAIRRAYLSALAAAIDRNKYYPRKSRRRAEQGTVTVAFVIAADGTISDVTVADPSGHRRLDTAARDAVRRLVRFQPIPEALARDRWPIRVPLDFRLR